MKTELLCSSVVRGRLGNARAAQWQPARQGPARRSRFVLAGGLTLLLAVAAHAQNFTIDWWTTAAGGNSSAGGNYTLTGTIGQPDAGKMSGGGFTLQGGFRSVVAALPAEVRPSLGVRLTNGVAIVYWPLWAADFALDQTHTLGSRPIPWEPVSLPYQTNATHVYVTVPAPAGPRFFQLRKSVAR